MNKPLKKDIFAANVVEPRAMHPVVADYFKKMAIEQMGEIFKGFLIQIPGSSESEKISLIPDKQKGLPKEFEMEITDPEEVGDDEIKFISDGVVYQFTQLVLINKIDEELENTQAGELKNNQEGEPEGAQKGERKEEEEGGLEQQEGPKLVLQIIRRMLLGNIIITFKQNFDLDSWYARECLKFEADKFHEQITQALLVDSQ